MHLTETREKRTRVLIFAVLLTAMAVGAALRSLPVLASDFPLHDGGLFLVMSREIRAWQFELPITTAYNGFGAPFAYPPLGIYVLAALSSLASPLDLLRLLPLLYAIAAIPVVFLLIRQVSDEIVAALAAFMFALTPAAFDWLVVGGGVTRGLGFVLALLAITVGVRAGKHASITGSVGAGVLLGLTVLTHLEAAAFAATSLVAISLSVMATRDAVRATAIATTTAAIIAAPWLLTIISRHGVDVFIGAAGSRQAWATTLQRLMELRLTGHSFLLFDVPLVLSLVGVVFCAQRGRWRLPVWGFVVLLTPAAGDYYITPVLAALAATGARTMIHGVRPRRRGVVSALAVAVALLNVLLVPNGIGQQLGPIPASDRAAMAELPSGNQPVAVFTRRAWWGEGPGEWLPALTDRSNAALAQGAEWLGSDRWRDERDKHDGLQECFSRTCIVAWMVRENTDTLFLSAVAGVPVDEFTRDARFLLVARVGDSAVLRLVPTGLP